MLPSMFIDLGNSVGNFRKGGGTGVGSITGKNDLALNMYMYFEVELLCIIIVFLTRQPTCKHLVNFGEWVT